MRSHTLLLVGSADFEVLALNREVLGKLGPHSELGVIRGAGHLFEEPGALEEVAHRAAQWFVRYLIPDRALGEAA